MLKGKSNLVLIGLMGSGKTMVSKKLGQLLGKKVISTDGLIEEKEGCPISEIFKTSGESYFRRLEREAVTEIVGLDDVIIDCGGGIVLDQENIDRLKEKGCLLYLSAGPDFLYEKIKQQTNRPLLQVKDPKAKIKELLNERRHRYEQADITVVSEGKSIDQICKEIVGLLKK
ncbi:MAG TPA: shikimate kinase [Candidatus Omnitrophota bacterium]|nr:shikimate kinase [Candidatus Omnitrophota bacterium]